MKIFNMIRYCAFVFLSIFLIIFVHGDSECEKMLQKSEYNYLAQSTLGNVFASFQQIFNIVNSSDEMKSKLNENVIRFAELWVFVSFEFVDIFSQIYNLSWHFNQIHEYLSWTFQIINRKKNWIGIKSIGWWTIESYNWRFMPWLNNQRFMAKIYTK